MLNKQSLVSVIDFDSGIYFLCYQARDNEDVDKVLESTDTFIQTLLTNTSCTHYIGFLGGSKETFRNKISSTYKAQRPESPDWYKKWGGIIKAHLRDKWKFQVVYNIEADDAVACAKDELDFLGINYILVHADKDIRQLDGNHYNIRTHKREYIDKLEASKILYKQILQGDVADNIKGCKGIGPKKASQLIDGLSTVYDMGVAVEQCFMNKYGAIEGKALFKEAFELCTLLKYAGLYTNLKLDYIEVPRVDIPESLTNIISDIFG